MKVQHPKKYNKKLATAMRAALLAGAGLAASSCSSRNSGYILMGDVPAPEPIPEEAQDDPSTKELGVRGEFPISPRMISFPLETDEEFDVQIVGRIPAAPSEVEPEELIVEQPKVEDKEDIYIEITAGKPAPNMDNPPEPPETPMLMGIPVPIMGEPPESPEEDSATEDAKAREELDELIQEIAKEKAEADKEEAKE